ncbi:MAG TPA: class I SAM-dependent methyltransferase, partial [Verrucomicrobiae bacterium]
SARWEKAYAFLVQHRLAKMKPVPPTSSYANRFQAKEDVTFYDSKEYGSGSYSSQIWDLQRPLLTKILEQHQAELRRPLKLLDFACGTGRVLSVLEPNVAAADGIDISAEMVAVAQTRCKKARLQVGDILTKPELLQKDYDFITAFRFLLNVEPDLRRRVLRRLREVIQTPHGLLVVNVHGNSRSLRHPSIVWRRWRERSLQTNAMLNEIAPDEARMLLRECGFQIARQYGFGILPPTLYRTPLRRFASVVDKTFAGDRWCNDWAIDMLFVCRPV